MINVNDRRENCPVLRREHRLRWKESGGESPPPTAVQFLELSESTGRPRRPVVGLILCVVAAILLLAQLLICLITGRENKESNGTAPVPNSIGMKQVRIPVGTFLEEGPEYEVEIRQL